MDSAVEGLKYITARSVSSRLRWKPALAVTASVLLTLTLAKVILGMPKPALVTAALSFLVWSVVFWTWHRDAAASIHGRVLRLLLSWLFVAGLVLGITYQIDRGGWLWFRLTGYERSAAEDLTDQARVPVGIFLSQHPIFSVDAQTGHQLSLKRGEYDINDTIVIPAGLTLTIEPGTALRFSAGRSLISYSPIIARGTEDQPILFTAKHQWLKWGVVGVINASKSVFEHVRFEHGRYRVVNGTNFPGSLSLIGSDVDIAHSRFTHLFGKDAVYVGHARVLIRDNVFEYTYKDGLDLDGGVGQIHDNVFVDCGDEGMDLSGDLRVEVFDNKILDSRGGRIAAEKDLEAIKARNTFGFSRNGG